MRLNLELGAKGENKKKPKRSTPLSGKNYERFINSLPSNDIVKSKLIALGKKVPSMTLGYIVDNIPLYIGRAEFEIKQEELKIMQENQRYEIESQSEEVHREENQEEGMAEAEGELQQSVIQSSSDGIDQDQSGRSDVHSAVSE